MDVLNRPEGCRDQTITCREKIKQADPNSRGDVEEVNEFCAGIMEWCAQELVGPYMNTSGVR
jgi:hypothetical protein